MFMNRKNVTQKMDSKYVTWLYLRANLDHPTQIKLAKVTSPYAKILMSGLKALIEFVMNCTI